MSLEVEARVRHANLISRDDQLELLFDDELSRRLLRDVYAKKEGRMSDPTDRPQPVKVEEIPRSELATTGQAPRRSPVPGMALAGIVFVVTIGVVVALVNRGLEVAASPVEVAEAFLEARNAHDAEAMMSLLADDAEWVRGGELLMDASNLPAAAEFERITGSAYDFSCIEDLPSQVRCDYTLENDLGRALGIVPSLGAFYLFEVGDGKIVRLENVESGEAFLGDIMVAWANWVEANHSEDAGVVTPENMADILEPESLALWEEYVPEFVASSG